MIEIGSWPRNDQSYGKLLSQVSEVLDLNQRLPNLPFLASSGYLSICQYSDAIEGTFEPVLQCFTDAYHDELLMVAAVDPAPSTYLARYGTCGAFAISGRDIAETYWKVMEQTSTGELIFSADEIALVGSSLRWAVWAERSWDIAIVLSDRVDGPWTSCGVAFVSPEEALAEFTEPHYKNPLTSAERTTFLRNVHEMNDNFTR